MLAVQEPAQQARFGGLRECFFRRDLGFQLRVVRVQAPDLLRLVG